MGYAVDLDPYIKVKMLPRLNGDATGAVSRRTRLVIYFPCDPLDRCFVAHDVPLRLETYTKGLARNVGVDITKQEALLSEPWNIAVQISLAPT